MPFGISSTPEVWQRRMHEFVEDLEGVEVIADDFLIAGFGETNEEINTSLERHELSEMSGVESEVQQSQDETSSNRSAVYGTSPNP